MSMPRSTDCSRVGIRQHTASPCCPPVVGGCGRSAEELEFSAAVVACCAIGYVVLMGIAIIGELLA